MPKVINKVLNTDTLEWEELKKYAVNELKTNREIYTLTQSIKKKGFITPIFIYKDDKYILDGAGRIMALSELKKQGYELEPIPVVYIQAETLEKAKELVILISSNHGTITEQSYKAFVQDFQDLTKFELNKISSFDYSPIEPLKTDVQRKKEEDVAKIIETNTLPIIFKNKEDYNDIRMKLDKMKKDLEVSSYAEVLKIYL
jgi:hypothetical protein